MAGYTRQSVADIINGSDITAPPINAEFNQIQSAFNGTTGHSHDGSTGNAPKIDLTTSVSGYLPAVHGGIGGKNNLAATTNPTTGDDAGDGYAPGSLWENTTTGRVFICVGNTANAAVWRELVTVITDNKIEPIDHDQIDLGTPTVRFQDLYLSGGISASGNVAIGGTLNITGATSLSSLTASGTTTLNGDTDIGNANTDTVTITAKIDSDLIPTGVRDLGSSTDQWTDLFIDGTATIDTLTVDENASVAGNLAVTGTSALTGNTTVTGTLGVTGDTTVANLSASGTTTITSVDLNSGAIDSTTIGSATPAAGTFTTLSANTSLTATTADIDGGTLDGVTIGGSTAASATVTDLTATGTSTLSTVDINAGAIDGTTIGSTTPSTGAFTTLSTSGQATLATVNIDGGTIDGTAIGGSATSSGAFTTVSASGGFTGDLTGDVTGNVTGNVTGAITGNVTGDLTGNVSASSGTSTFNNVTINGSLDMDANTTATITNLSTPVNNGDAASKLYVDTAINDLIGGAPATLDTLNEIAASLNDDANLYGTLTASIATKLPLAGGTMSGAIAMGTNKITGAGDPTAAQDVSTKNYTDNQDALQVSKSGDSMSGNLAMGSNNITGLATPTANDHAATKGYTDGILGSATVAATSATNAATSEANAATSETNAANSATAAASSATSAAASLDSFDDRYLGAKATAPTVDNDGDALIIGALYFDTTTDTMKVYGSSGWTAAGSSVNGTSDRQTYSAIANQTVFAATYDAGYVDVYLNGVKLLAGTDFTAVNGTSIVLASGAAANDIVDIVAYGTFVLADHLTETQSDAKYVELAGDTMTGSLLGVTQLGVGLTNPSGTVQIKDTSAKIQLTNATNTGSAEMAFRTTAGSNRGFVAYNFDSDYMSFRTGGSGEAARFDSAGNFFVGTQGTILPEGGSAANDAGVSLDASNYIAAARYQNISGYFNRIGNDGDIVQFRKDGAGVGSISNRGSTVLQISSSSATGLDFGGSINPMMNGAISSNSADLGWSGARFRDIFLAGKLDIDAPSGNTANVIKASANNTRATLEITGKTSGGTSVRGIVGSYGDASKVDIGTLSGHALSFLVNNQERAIINTDGRLLVGKNNASHTVEGGAIFDDGRIYSTTDGQFTFTANRLNSDGEIIRIQKNTSTVGSIVVFDGDNVGFLSGVNNHGGIICGTSSIVPALSGTYSNGATDIGTNTSRWRDLYLSGGIQFDSRSNKLDDYEEGSWSPASGNGSNPLTVNGTGNRYTKIGRQVIAYFDINWDSGNSTASAANITGLPFTPSSDHEGDGAATIGYITGSAGVDFVIHCSNSNPSFNFYPDGSGGSANYSALAGRRIAGYIQYYTNS